LVAADTRVADETRRQNDGDHGGPLRLSQSARQPADTAAAHCSPCQERPQRGRRRHCRCSDRCTRRGLAYTLLGLAWMIRAVEAKVGSRDVAGTEITRPNE